MQLLKINLMRDHGENEEIKEEGKKISQKEKIASSEISKNLFV
jgi:hypothetical protein